MTGILEAQNSWQGAESCSRIHSLAPSCHVIGERKRRPRVVLSHRLQFDLILSHGLRGLRSHVSCTSHNPNIFTFTSQAPFSQAPTLLRLQSHTIHCSASFHFRCTTSVALPLHHTLQTRHRHSSANQKKHQAEEIMLSNSAKDISAASTKMTTTSPAARESSLTYCRSISH